MRTWLASHYDVLKDFAGPIATVFAASVAGCVALIFGTIQWRITAAQRDIARDNLRFALIQRRYAIYDAAKHLLEHAVMTRRVADIYNTKIREWNVQIEEAHFYFPDDICKHLEIIKNDAETFFHRMYERENVDEDNTAEWDRTGEQLAENVAVLRAHYAELPKTFRRPLAFKQLIKE
jgi:hypothetical protein